MSRSVDEYDDVGQRLPDLRTAYMFWLPSVIGIAGLHRFYLGKIGSGILYLLTGGLFGIGTIYDALTMRRHVAEARRRRRIERALDMEEEALIDSSDPLADRRGGSPAQPRTESLEHVVLRVAKQNKGVATPGEVALEGGVSVDEAQGALDSLAGKGYAEMRVRDSGQIIFVFRDFLPDDSLGM